MAAVLEANQPLRLAFVKWLIGHDVDFVYLETQKTVESGDRLDLWVDARSRRSSVRHVIAMENKIEAGEGPDQLLRYERHLKYQTTADTRTLVYATLHERTSFQESLEGPPPPLHSVRYTGSKWRTG